MKKLLLIPALTLVLAACGNEADSEEHEGEHSQDETHEEGHSHGHTEVLDMGFTYSGDSDEIELTVNLTEEDEPYEADRVRFEVVNPDDEDATEWVNTEDDGAGNYTGATSELEPGEYEVVIHVNGPEDLHEHTTEMIEVE